MKSRRIPASALRELRDLAVSALREEIRLGVDYPKRRDLLSETLVRVVSKIDWELGEYTTIHAPETFRSTETSSHV